MPEPEQKNPRPEYSARLKSLIEKASLTQAELADAVGVSPATVSIWVNEGKVPHRDTLTRLCVLLEVQPEWLVHGRGIKGIRWEDDPLLNLPVSLRQDMQSLALAAQRDKNIRNLISHLAKVVRTLSANAGESRRTPENLGSGGRAS